MDKGLHYGDFCTPTRQGITIDTIHEGLGDGLKEFLRLLRTLNKYDT